MFGGTFLLPLYYQQVRYEGTIGAGLSLAPQAFGLLLAPGTGGLTDKIGTRPIPTRGRN
ncbi:hypothetical protein [Streptomyces sp. NPDC003996]